MSSPARPEHIARFLAAAGFGAARCEPLAGDASFRRYVRLRGGPRPAVLMDAPPEREDVRPYLHVTARLRALGLSAPEVIAVDPSRGLVLIEDFGDDTFTRLLDSGTDPEPLYTLATDVLVHLARVPAEAGVREMPPYDDDRLWAEARLLVEWYLPAVAAASEEALREYKAIWPPLFALARRVPEVLVLRDFHVDNLMRLPGRAGLSSCGLLDYQDAVRGPVSYDLMSLLEDARRDVPLLLQRRMTARFLAALPSLDPETFATSYAILAAHRHCKVIGIFTRLSRRDGKHGYLAHIPRVWRLLESHLDHPALAELARWLATYLPPACRRPPAPPATEAAHGD